MPEDPTAVAVSDVSADVGADTDVDLSAAVGGETDTAGDTTQDVHVDAPETQETVEQTQPTDDGLAEFRGSITARFKQIEKDAPGLSAFLDKFPKAKDAISATFRREAAYRELGTVQELREFREAFPRGRADVEETFKELGEIEQLDRAFDTRDAEGNYSGHPQLINDWFNRDRQAATALFRTLPREWARLDPQGYSDVMGKVVGATFRQQGIPQFVGRLQKAAEKAGQGELAEQLAELAGWIGGFTETRTSEPSPEDRRLQGERQALDRDKAEQRKESANRFHASFMSESAKLQQELVEKNPLLQRLPKTIPEQKRKDIVSKVMARVRDHLSKNSSFMRNLKPAYQRMDMKAVLDIQRHAWSQPWLVNSYIRKVLAEETPGIVAKGSQQQRRPAPANTPPKGAPQKNYKEGNRWFRPDGTPFTTLEVLQNKHLQ